MLGTTFTIPDMNSVSRTLNETAKNFNWSTSSKDLIILLIFAVMVLIHIFSLKKNKVFSLLFSVYTSYLAILFFPYNLWLSHLSLNRLVWIKVAGFIILIIIFMEVFSRNRIFTSSHTGIIKRVFQSIIWGVLNAGLILALLSTLLPLSFLNQFSGLSLNVLATKLAKFIWIVLPMVLLLFSVKFRKHGPGRPPILE